MNTRKLVILAASVLFGASAMLLAACGDDTNNPSPTTPHDGGAGIDSTVGPTSDSGGDTGSTIDANLPDVGDCKSDSSLCNSCYTVQQNPLNGCSPATGGCIQFDNSRVPDAG